MLAVVVGGLPGVGKTALARPLARELGLPLLSKDVVKESLGEVLGCVDHDESRRLGSAANELLWSMLAECARGAVIEGWFSPYEAEVRVGLARAAAGPVLEIWCHCPLEEAERRYVARIGHRHPVHFDSDRLDAWHDWAARARPMGLGPVREVDTGGTPDVAALAALVRSASAAGWAEPIRY